MRHLELCSVTWPSSRGGAFGIARYSFCATCSEEEDPGEQWVVEVSGAEWNCMLEYLGLNPPDAPPPPANSGRDTAFQGLGFSLSGQLSSWRPLRVTSGQPATIVQHAFHTTACSS